MTNKTICDTLQKCIAELEHSDATATVVWLTNGKDIRDNFSGADEKDFLDGFMRGLTKGN